MKGRTRLGRCGPGGYLLPRAEGDHVSGRRWNTGDSRRHPMERMSEECFYAGKQAKIAWFAPRDFGALAALFERPYWARIWVIQEVLLAREAIVVLGKSSVPLASLLKGQMVDSDKFHVSHVLPPWTQLTGPSIDGDVDAFLEMLIKASPCCASDGRDKVFALLGLIQGGHLEGLVADYSKKLDVVYTGIAAYFLIRHAQSKILKWAALSQSPLSWVPAGHWNRMVDQIPRQSMLPSPLTRLEKYPDYNVFPDHPCRASSLTGQHPGIQDVLSVLRPRVFSEGGVLSIHAYPVIQAYSATGAFNMDFHESNDVSEFRAADRGIHSYDLPWSICGTSQLDALYSWIVEVPNCDVFLHLKPQGLVPNIFKIKSVCHLNLVTDRRMPLLDLNPPSTQGSSTFSSARDLGWTAPQLLFDTHQLPLLISRLVPFEFSELLFLQSYETVVNRDATLGLVGAIGAGSGNDESTCLSTTDLEEYNRWMKYLDERFGGLTEFASEGLNRDFDATLRTVPAYLDRWDDSTRWDRLHKILETVPWHSYVTALRDLCDEFAAFVWNHSETRKDSTKRIRHQLEVTLDILKSAVDRLGSARHGQGDRAPWRIRPC